MTASLRIPDHSTLGGAERLAASIVSFWRSQGYVVDARVEHISAGIGKHPHCAVRSDMVNGMPRKKLAPVIELKTRRRA